MFQPNAILRANSGGTTWYPPDHHNFQLTDRLAELRQPAHFVFAVTVFGIDGQKYTGFARDVRDAYQDADHQRRYAKYTIEGLLKKRRASVRRELVYRAKLQLAGLALEMQDAAFVGVCDERNALQAELTTVREANKQALQAADDRIRSLENNGNEKDKGMALVRQALEEAGITQGNLVERVKALAAERDQYRLAAQQNAAATV